MSKWFFNIIFVFCIVGCKEQKKNTGTPSNEMVTSAPVIISINPVGPANNNFPVVSGTATPMTILKLYSDNSCSTQIGIGNSVSDGTFAVTAQISDNTTATIYAKSFNGSYASACSTSSVSYTEVSTIATQEVVFTATLPASPGGSLTPFISGTADPYVTVYLYTSSNCSTAPVASTTTDGAGDFTVATSITAGSTTTFYGRSMDGSNNTTPCSSDSIVYQHTDVVAPAAPVITGINPVGPANNNSPVISGTAEASSTISFYTDNTCSGAIVGTGSTNASGTFSVVLTVNDDETNTYYATATDASNNASSCSSTSVAYTEDSTIPTEPVFTGTNPVSPGLSLTPVISGTADANTTVKLFTTNNCSGAALYTTTANGSGVFSVNATVTASSTTTYYATSTDQALNVSDCTSTPITYVQGDAVVPNEPVITGINPVGPANYNSPIISGTSEANTAIKFYAASDCSGAVIGSGTTNGAGNFNITLAVTDDITSTFYATATDASNNVSDCSSTSATYVEDSTLPAVPVFTSTNPVSPAESLSPTISGTAEVGSTVKLYTTTDCSGSELYSTTTNGSGVFSVVATVTASSTTTYYATAMDLAMNVSACTVTPISYQQLDSTAPARPIISSINPVGPSDVNTPDVIGTAEANSTVKAYTNNTCTSTVVGTATADGTGNYTVAVNAVDNTTTSYWVTATDASNNVSPCSTTTVSYTAYSIAEGMGWFSGTTTTAVSTNTNINQSTAYSLRWTSGEFHSTYFSHSTTTNPHQIEIKAPGDYFASVTVPLTGAVAGNSVRLEIRVNGVAVDTGRGESGYLATSNGHRESSLHVATLLDNLDATDIIDVTVIQAGAAGTVTVVGSASMSLEFIDSTKNIFFAKSDRTTSSTNLNQATAYPLQWTQTIVDGIYSHSDSSNSQNIVINSNGNYLAYVNIPVTSTTANANVKMVVKLNGVALSYGTAAQGVIKASGHTNSSIHWYALIPNVTSGSTLTVETSLEGAVATVTVPAAKKASIYLQEISPTGLFFARTQALITNTNWNSSTTGQNAKWTSVDSHDTSQFSHSTVTNPDRITLLQNGDYFLGINVPMTSTGSNTNASIRARVNGTIETAAQSKSGYTSGASGNTESSEAMTYLFRKRTANQYIDINSYREAANGTVTSNGDACIFIIYKPNSISP